MGQVVRLFDRLVNLMSGAGTTADKRAFAHYAIKYIDPAQIEASYRGSWLMRKAVDLPPYDMTRAGRDWQAQGDQIEKLEAEERRLDLWDKLRRGLVLGRLGGGALVLGVKQGQPYEELDLSRIRAGDLQYAYLASRWRLGLGQPITDPASPWFGQPSYFQMTPAGGQPVQVHPSRVIAFRGQQVPDMATCSWQDVFWGDPLAQSIIDAVQNADMAQGGFATLIDEAKLDIIKMPGLMQNAATTEYEQRFMERLRLAALGKSTHRALVIDAEEDWEQRQINWAGMPDVIAAYVQIVAGAADIPATRLLGKSPDGMNATGEGDENNYRTMIAGRQTADLKPLIDRIDDIMIPSTFGSRDPKISWVFAPLSVLSEAEAADVALKKAQATKIYSDSSLVPTRALEEGVQNQLVEDGIYPGLDGVLDAMSDDERFPSLSAPDPNEPDPSAMQADDPATAKGGGQAKSPSAGAGGSQPTRRRVNDARFMDAAPKTLYVQRKLLNAAEFIRWAKDQGFETTTPADELHVTVTYSRQPIDWMTIGQDWSSDKDGNLTVPAGGARIVQPLGDKGAVVLLFASNDLTWRHKSIIEAGASHDFEEYQPHVTITYAAPAGLDLSKVEPYTGPLKFGPELFSEAAENWASTIVEDAEGEHGLPFGDAYNEGEPRDYHGRWTAGLAAHVEEALRDRGSHRATSFGKVSERNASAVLTHTGVDIAGHERIIGSSEIRHAMMSHGNPVREAARGQVAIERGDFAHIPTIVEQAHTITAQGTRSASKGLRLVYQATIGGHEYHYTEQVRAKQIVALKTIRKAVK